ncbi:hypothetical protein LTR95_009872 [Oleoguttula sp. CCFEE 5521]
MKLPNDHVRLIRILPRDPEDTIRCQTVISPLSAGVQYLALSYTWGNPPESHTIEVDGKQFLIRKNLWRFLDQISAPSRKWQDLLWIDSISIDQTDAEEKSHQIGLMGRIYEQARKVVIWLGPAYNQSDVAMEALVDFGRSTRNNRKRTRFWSEAGGLALMRLCNRTYWTRLWVFQEMMLAKDILLMCGSHVTEWAAFYEVLTAVDARPLVKSDRNEHRRETDLDGACQVLTALEGPLPRVDRRNGDVQNALNSPALAMTRRKGAMADPKEGLWSLMNATQGLDCAEPKDRIFALLGVADPKISASITADYRTPLRRLLNAVLQTRHAETRPSSTEAVAIECGQLTDMFGLDSSSIYELENEDGIIALPEVETMGCPLGNPSHIAITLWWTTWYNHDAVQWLLLGTDKSSNELLLEAWAWAVKHKEFMTMRHISMTGRIDTSRYNDALHTKLAYDHDDQVDCVKLLLEIGADANAQGGEYGNALQAACKRFDEEEAIKVVDMLIQHGADVNAQGGLYGNALQAACTSGHEKAVEILIGKGADVNAQGGKCGNALQTACAIGREKLVELLIQNGADIDAQGGYYGNALQAADSRGHKKVAKLIHQEAVARESGKLNAVELNVKFGNNAVANNVGDIHRNREAADKVKTIQFELEDKKPDLDSAIASISRNINTISILHQRHSGRRRTQVSFTWEELIKEYNANVERVKAMHSDAAEDLERIMGKAGKKSEEGMLRGAAQVEAPAVGAERK